MTMRLETTPEYFNDTATTEIYTQLRTAANRRDVTHIVTIGETVQKPVQCMAVIELAHWADRQSTPGLRISLNAGLAAIFLISHVPQPTVWFVDPKTIILANGTLLDGTELTSLHLTLHR